MFTRNTRLRGLMSLRRPSYYVVHSRSEPLGLSNGEEDGADKEKRSPAGKYYNAASTESYL
jgi:hypothetical protein